MLRDDSRGVGVGMQRKATALAGEPALVPVAWVSVPATGTLLGRILRRHARNENVAARRLVGDEVLELAPDTLQDGAVERRLGGAAVV